MSNPSGSGAAHGIPRRFLFVFLDGVGIGPADPERNPFLRADLPVLVDLLERVPTLEEPACRRGEVACFPLDARLGVDGIPQSGTGQASLLTGHNGARAFGRHFGPWTPVRLRPLLAEENVFLRMREAGRRVAFANAYPEAYPGSRSRRLVAAPPLAALSAGVLTRHGSALSRGDAVASEIVNDRWRVHPEHEDLPEISPREAGIRLARIANRHDFTGFAHYGTDHAGHRGGIAGSVAALELVDAFLGGVLDRLDPDVNLLIASDHGNIEDMTAEHTRNPALGLLVGERVDAAGRALRSILDVADFLLQGARDPRGTAGKSPGR